MDSSRLESSEAQWLVGSLRNIQAPPEECFCTGHRNVGLKKGECGKPTFGFRGLVLILPSTSILTGPEPRDHIERVRGPVFGSLLLGWGASKLIAGISKLLTRVHSFRLVVGVVMVAYRAPYFGLFDVVEVFLASHEGVLLQSKKSSKAVVVTLAFRRICEAFTDDGHASHSSRSRVCKCEVRSAQIYS